MYYKFEQLMNILANNKNCVFSLDHLCSSALEYIQYLEAGIDRCYELAKKVESAQSMKFSEEYCNGYMKGFEAAYMENKWIDATEDKPKNDDDVFVLLESEHADVAWYDNTSKTWHLNGYNRGIVTHWMHVPELSIGGR